MSVTHPQPHNSATTPPPTPFSGIVTINEIECKVPILGFHFYPNLLLVTSGRYLRQSELSPLMCSSVQAVPISQNGQNLTYEVSMYFERNIIYPRFFNGIGFISDEKSQAQ